MKKNLAYIATFFLLFVPHTSFAKIAVAAIVGEEVITTYDLEQRLKIFTVGSNVEINEQNRRALLQQVRESLIVEKLKTQAAEEAAIVVTDAELTDALRQIAQGNNITVDELSSFIEKQGISFASLYERVKAELLWDKLIRVKITPQVSVSEIEIEESERIFLAKQKREEVKYDFLSYKFSDTESKDLAEELSYKIYNDLLSRKLDFANLKNSERSTAADAKEWEDMAKLKPIVQSYLKLMKAGDISEPFVSDKEILILKLIAKRQIDVKADQDLRLQIQNKLFLSKLENRISSYLRDIENSYYIERKDIL